MSRRVTVEEVDNGFTIEQYEPKKGENFEENFTRRVAKDFDSAMEESRAFMSKGKKATKKKRSKKGK